MNKQQLNELEKISNVLSKELLSQNYDEADQMKFDKSLVINLLNLLNEAKEHLEYSVRWVPYEISYKFNPDELELDKLVSHKDHKFFTIINGTEYSYYLSSNDLLINEGLDDITRNISEFLISRSLLKEFEMNMAPYVNIANHNAKLTQRTSL